MECALNIASTSNIEGDTEHRGVRYFKAKLTSLGYRIEVVKQIAGREKCKIRECHSDTGYFLSQDLMFVVGTYTSIKAARDALLKFRATICSPDFQESLAGIKVIEYRAGQFQYFITYDFFMRKVLPHINSQFAKHMMDASFVNDIVVSAGHKAAETLLDHNRSVNASCSTSQNTLDSMVDSSLSNETKKALTDHERVRRNKTIAGKQRDVDVNYLMHTGLVSPNGRELMKYGESGANNFENRLADHEATFPSIAIYETVTTINSRRLEKAVFKEPEMIARRCPTLVKGKLQTELFEIDDAFGPGDIIKISKTCNQLLLETIDGAVDASVLIEQERTKQKHIDAEAATKQAEATTKQEQERTKQSLAQLASTCTDETKRNRIIDFLLGDQSGLSTTKVSASDDTMLPSTNKSIECDLCHLVFLSRVTLQRHIKNQICTKVKVAVAKELTRECHLCHLVFKLRGSLTRHIKNQRCTRVKVAPKPRECHLCHLVLSNPGNLKRHLANNSCQKA